MREEMLVRGLRCHTCNYIIFSRSSHDYRTCNCGNLAVDGGPHIVGDTNGNPQYYRIIGSDYTEEYVPFPPLKDYYALRLILRLDYINKLDKYGIHKGVTNKDAKSTDSKS